MIPDVTKWSYSGAAPWERRPGREQSPEDMGQALLHARAHHSLSKFLMYEEVRLAELTQRPENLGGGGGYLWNKAKSEKGGNEYDGKMTPKQSIRIYSLKVRRDRRSIKKG